MPSINSLPFPPFGFSVDLSAHITYAYAKAPGELSPDERAIAALETLGWPVFLGAFSTIVGIMVLALVDAHIILIFFKTVFLVITFSLLHGMVFLPILLTVAMPNERKVPTEAADREEREKQKYDERGENE